MNRFSINFALVSAVLALTSQVSVAQRPFYLVPGLHPGYDQLVSMRPVGMETSGANAAPNVGGMAWLPDGRLFIASMSSNAAGGPNANRLGASHGYLFSGIPGATSNAAVTVTQISTGYQMPSGAVAVGDTIFVLDNEDGLTRLVPDGDNWTKSTVFNGALGRTPGVTVQNANRTWTGGLVYHDGFLYAAVGMGLIPGGTSFGFTGTEEADIYRGKGSIWKISTDGAVVDTFAAGLRNPVSMALGPDDQIFYTDNEGSFMPASAMFHVTEGAFFGHPKTPFDDRTRSAPAIIFPYGSNPTGGSATNPTVARVATDMLTLRNGRYIGQMLVGTNHTTGVNRVFLEKIPDASTGSFTYQGALFPFSQGMGVGSGSGGAAAIPGVLEDFTTNVNRMSYGPDGQIYLGGGNSPGAASNGSHGFVGGLQYGLARMVPNADTVFEMKAVRSMGPFEMEIEFTEPVVSVATGNFTVRQYGYLQGGNSNNQSYGAGKQQGGVSTLTVTDVALNEDRTRATLIITGLAERPAVAAPGSTQDRTWGNIVQINVTGIEAESGRAMWGDGNGGGVAWYTLNKFGPGLDVETTPISLARAETRARTRTGLLFQARHDGLMVRSPVEGAYTLRTMDTQGRVIATHVVEAGRREFLLPNASLSGGLTVVEARATDGRRFAATTAGRQAR